MTADTPAPLVEQRLLLRQRMGAQRLRLAQHFAETDRAHTVFPRSVTMRWLIREPELVARIVGRIAGARAARAVPAALIVIRFLSSTVVP